MIFSMFHKVLDLSISGFIAVAVILLIKAIARDKLGMKFQYVIWFILILRLIPGVNLCSSMSLYNYIPSNSNTIMNMAVTNVADNVSEVNDIKNIEDFEEDTIESQDLICEVNAVLPIIWAVGVITILFTVAIVNLKTYKKIKKSEIIKDKEILKIFEECKETVNTQKNIVLIATDIVKTPCIYGVINPVILIPKFMIDNKSNIEFKYIFLHELAHYKRHDLCLNYVIHIIQSLYWFNPVIRYGLNRMRDDREVICDSYVLSILNSNETIKYGNSLLDLVEVCSRAPWLPQMAGIINNKNKVKRRIIMIKKFKKGSFKLSAVAMAILVLAGGGLLTEANAIDINTNNSNSQVESQVVNGRIVDKIDYTFVNDEEVIGKWEAVDFVKNPRDFNAAVKSWKGDLYLKKLIFLPNGKMAQPVSDGIKSDEVTPVSWLTWTKGLICHAGDKTASSYTIKEINGTRYMFYEWKSGDYSIRGMKPCYYVLKETPTSKS